MKEKEKKVSKIKVFYGKISYAIKPFIIFVAVLFVTYFGNQLVYSFKGLQGGTQWPWIPLDGQIPLISWFVWFYYLTFPLGIVTFFYLAYANKKAFLRIYYTLIISFAISGFIYLFAQTKFIKPDFTPVSFTDKLVVGTWDSTNPINCFPSQHSFMAIAMILACLTAGGGIRWWFKAFTIPCCLMILMATFFIKQHFFLDWVGSLVIMLVVYFGVILFEKWRKSQKNAKNISKNTQK